MKNKQTKTQNASNASNAKPHSKTFGAKQNNTAAQRPSAAKRPAKQSATTAERPNKKAAPQTAAKRNGSSTNAKRNIAPQKTASASAKRNAAPKAAPRKSGTQQTAAARKDRHVQPKGKLKVIFLGGVGEIGKNMTAFEYGDSIVVIDVGMSFPGTDMPGVDVVIPDVTYLSDNRDKIKGILLTHGHEDHIGALPFVVEKLGGRIDVYGTKLTLALAENKLVEHNVADRVNLVAVSDRSVVSLGAFTAEFIHVSHSVAGSVAICLRTPVGTVLHTGDFKVDYTPLGNEIMNLNRFAEIGKQGVLLLMSESTNVEKPGYTLSESTVQETLNKIFGEAKGRRLIIATFASNVDRLGMIIDLAKTYRRKIALSGKSMNKYIETAVRVGTMSIDPNMFVDIDKVNSVEDGKLVILSTGSQGEPMSALTRMADGEFNKVTVGANDTIVISANPIPGNERDVYTVINKLYRLGANVVYSALSAVHVSGHACQEELKLIYTLVKPKYFIPVHGEYRHLKQHAMLVENLKHKKSNIIIPDIGDVVELDATTFRVSGAVPCGSVMVDGLGVGDVGNSVLRDRLSLAEDGILVCVMTIDKHSGKLLCPPEIVSKGCFFNDGANTVPDELKKLVLAECADFSNAGALKAAVQKAVRHYFRVTLKRNPTVLPIVVEV